MASELLQLQWKFMRMVPKLIDKAHELGFEVTVGDAFRDPRLHGAVGVNEGYGHPKSTHKVRLAIDLNLFCDGSYIMTDMGHRDLHKFWVSIGGAPMIESDPNHYSLAYQGMR